MPSGAVTVPQDLPSAEELVRLIECLRSAAPQLHSARILESSQVPAAPQLLDACAEVDVSALGDCGYVLSQCRGGKSRYITVHGRRSWQPGQGMKKVLSNQMWPRTKGSRRLQPVSLHRWITTVVRGAPPFSDAEATHICGNSACIAGAHLRWQQRSENLLDQTFHDDPSVTQHVALGRHMSRLAWSQ